MLNDIFRQVDNLQSGLNASWLRAEVLANNIANNDTPNFKRSDVSFQSLLENEEGQLSLKATNEKHFSSPQAGDAGAGTSKIVTDEDTAVRMDGNNVDVEYESAELAKNQIWYLYMLQKVSNEFGRLNTVINQTK